MKRKHRKLILLTALAGMLLTNSAVLAAIPADTEEFELDTIVVTATKTEKSIKDVPASVSVITADDLAKANIQTLDQALHYVPGLYVKESQGMMGTKISLRGMSQSRVLVLLDGIPLNNGYAGGANWGNIPIALIDRVEVTKGSFSSLYGSNAMGGVINIITKSDAKTQTIIKGGFGGNGTTAGSFFTSGHNDNNKFRYNLSYDKREVDGYVNQPEQNPGGNRYGDFATENENTGIKLMYDFSEGERLSLLRTESDYTYGYYKGGKDRGQRKVELTGITYEKKLDDTKELKIHLGEQNYKKYWQRVGTNYSSTPVKTQEADVSLNWAVNDKNLLTIGVAAKEDKGSQYDLQGVKTTAATAKTNAVYLQDEITLNPRSTLYLGARYDEWKTSNTVNNGKIIADRKISKVSPKASVHYKADDKVTLYASAGKSLNSPTLMNVAFDYNDLQKNSELEPEILTSYEIGTYITAAPQTTTKLAVFKNNVENLIYQGKSRWEQGDAEILGFEVEVKHKFTPELSGFVNYTYNDTKFTKLTRNNVNYKGNHVPTVPMDTLTFGCTYAKDKWTTNLLGRYIGTAYEDEANTVGFMSHFVADVKLNYAMTKDTSLSLSVDNIFDREYLQRVGTFNIYAPGRIAYLELTQKF